MITIEVFGPGCQRCHATLQAVREAIQTTGIEASVSQIRDPKEMAMAHVIFTPAVRVNGTMKCLGRVPRADEVAAWLQVERANAA